MSSIPAPLEAMAKPPSASHSSKSSSAEASTPPQERVLKLLERLAPDAQSPSDKNTTLPPLSPVAVRRELFPSAAKGASDSVEVSPQPKRSSSLSQLPTHSAAQSMSSAPLQPASSSSSSSAYKTPKKSTSSRSSPATLVDATPKRFRSRSANPESWEKRRIRFARLHGTECRDKDGAFFKIYVLSGGILIASTFLRILCVPCVKLRFWLTSRCRNYAFDARLTAAFAVTNDVGNIIVEKRALKPACRPNCRMNCKNKVSRARRAELFVRYYRFDEDGQKAMLIGFGRFPDSNTEPESAQSADEESDTTSSTRSKRASGTGPRPPQQMPTKPGKLEVLSESEDSGDEEKQAGKKKPGGRKIPRFATKKRERPRKSPNSRRARHANTEWYVDRQQVCKTWMCNTFQVAPRKLTNLTPRKSKRGKHASNVIDPRQVQLVHGYIKSFPAQNHYCRTKCPHRTYISHDGITCAANLYQLFESWLPLQ